MPRLAFVVAFVAGVAGCNRLLDSLKIDNDQSCQLPSNVGHPGCPDAPPDTRPGVGGPCQDNSVCTAEAYPICDINNEGGTCVQCTTNDSHLCVGQTPVCNTNDRCTGCTKHSDCLESNLCLPDGSCASSVNVAYVNGSIATDGDCTKMSPCTKIDKAAAMKSLVKVTGMVTARCSIGSTTGLVQIFADPGAKLVATDDISALDVKGDSNVEVNDLQINNKSPMDMAAGVTLSGMAKLTLIHVIVSENTGRGINATGGTLTVTRSTISNNLGGGIQLTGRVNFHIIGNVIFGNGGPGTAMAIGIFVSVNAPLPDAPLNELDFNSISRNTGNTIEQGIRCDNAISVVTGSNNIIWNNGIIAGVSTVPSTFAQVGGNGCSYTYSDIGPVGIAAINGNLNFDPAFIDEPGGNLHLMATSMAAHLANPQATLTGLPAKDIDGDPRITTGIEMAADMGADQISKAPAP